MRPEISKKILGRMLSREATEQVIKKISIGFYIWMSGNYSPEYAEFTKNYLKKHGENGIPLDVAFNWYLENILKIEE